MARLRKGLESHCIGLLVVALTSLAPAPATANDEDRGPRTGYGFRTGLGIDPDQWVVGAQTLLGSSLGVLRFAPSLDLGFGSSVTTYALNLDLLANGEFPGSRSEFYAGAGPTLVHWEFSGDTENDLELGLSLVGGLRLPTSGTTQYNVETRFGLSDAPDFRILAGILFGSGRPRL